MRAVGESLQRVDAIKKVTGQAQYVDDIIMPRMLYAQVKRSPYPHARILRIDTSKAEALPGVRSVITGDCYTKRCGLYLEDKNFLAVGTAKYRGEAVAAVAAETPEIADEAVELIEVEYEQLPAVTNAVEGMKPDAPLIHPDLHTYKVAPIFHPVPHTNISHHYKLRKGDVDKAFEACDVVTENTYYIPHVQHVPLEPHCAVAQYDLDGKVTVWGSIQSPYAVRQALSAAFDIPLNKPVAVSDITDISAIVRNMCYEQYSANINRKFSVDLYFKLLLYKLNEKIIYKTDSVKVNDSVHFEKLLWIRESIYRWPGREWTLDEMAKELSLSRSRFQHLYSDTFGKSVSQDLIQSRIEKASDMLRKSDLTLKDISLSLIHI